MFWNILDEQRRSFLPALGFCRDEGFYLAGGTALALQIGHRDSVDFDLFKPDAFDTAALFERLSSFSTGHRFTKVQDEPNTLGVVADGVIKLSFMRYPYATLRPLITADQFDLADLADIGCMKLSAITGRGTMKDYVDLHFILQRIPLKELLALCAVKLPQLDRALVLKALVYFDDLDPEPILYTEGSEVPFRVVQRSLIEKARRAY